MNNFKQYNNTLFIHIPKTAGTYIEKILKNEKIVHNINLINTGTHHQYLKNYNLNNYDFTFTFIRNPIDRFISSYYLYDGKCHQKYNS